MMVWALDGYVPVTLVGSGSTGVVVSARESATGTIVAVKYLSGDFSELADFVVRYRGEVAVLGLIEHPHVANVYEFIEQSVGAAVVTELVDGVSLRSILDHTGPLEPQAALYLVKGALLGLREVHGRGIVHRALRPANIVIGVDGIAKITDVGLALPSRDRTPTNPVYAAPELWTGGQPTRTSDVYAATAILFECLTGRPPTGMGGAHLGRSGQSPNAAIAEIPTQLAPEQLRVFLALGFAVDAPLRLADAEAALQMLDIAAFDAFGPTWFDTGRAQLMSALARTLAAVANAAPARPSIEPAPALTIMPTPVQTSLPTPAPAIMPTVAAQLTLRRPVRRPGSLATTSASAVVTPVSASPAVIETSVPRRAAAKRWTNIAIAVVVLVLITAGTAVMVMSRTGQDAESPLAAATNSHVPTVLPGPAIPVPTETGPNADATKPARPVGLRITGRSVTGVSLDWVATTDDVKVAGYIVLRDGSRVATTYTPGYTDTGLRAKRTYTYAVAAFDEAGNISLPSASVTTTTLSEPDVTPPSVPTNLRTTGRSTSSIVLAWSDSRDNIGVAGYEVFRDGGLVASVHHATYVDVGLAAGTTHTYKVRAFDTSNNASGDSATITASTLAAPDTTPPSKPATISAIGKSSTTIDVSWAPSADNVGVIGYLVYRDGGQVSQVAGTTFTDQGLSPSTPYTYAVRAIDAAGNTSPVSDSAAASTMPAPTTPPPTTDPAPVIISVSLNVSNVDCVVTVEATVVASGPMDVVLDYTITGAGAGSTPISFTAENLTWTQVIGATGDPLVDGVATASAGGQSATANWTACVPTIPPTG